MNVVELTQRLRDLQQQNQRLRQAFNTSRNSDSYRGQSIDFQTKYKKALKQIYEVIQANKQLKDQLDKFRTSRSKIDENMADVRKEQIYKVYENVLNQKNQLNEKYHDLEVQNQSLHSQVQSLEAQIEVLKGEKLYLAQQQQALEAKSMQGQGSSKGEQLQQLQQRFRQKQQQFHRTLQNYEQHHITLSNQAKKSDQRNSELQQRLVQNDKNWRNRFQEKEIQLKDIKSNVRQEYQQQINILRKQITSLKSLNNQLMTKLQTIELEGHKDTDINEYEVQMLTSIKELRLQMQPLKKQIFELQEQNHFEKEQAERERTQLQLKLYDYESQLQHYSIQSKNQEDKISQLNELIKKHSDNELIIKRLEEENRILGGRVIVLESKQIAIDYRKEGSRKLQENILEFQTRVEMLLNEKENVANVKNISVHQLVSLKAYIAEMDQKLKSAYQQNQYATKKYKSYKEKYLGAVKQIKNHEVLHNTLKSKIMGYDKLVQRLQSQLEKNVSISEMEVIEMNTKTTHEQVQIESFKKKYQSLKQKLVLQQKYNKQQLETVKLNYQTKIVDLNIKIEEMNSLRQAITLYKEKNEELTSQLHQRDNQMLELKLSFGKMTNSKADNESPFQKQTKQLAMSLQQTIRKQQAHILKITAEARLQQDSSRKRILTLQRQLHEQQGEFNRVKLSSSTRNSTQRSTEQLSSQNKKLKNKISQLQNELILLKGRASEQSTRNSYESEFKISNLEIQKNDLANRLETEITYKKRLEKQMNELVVRNGQLEAELTQATIQNNRKFQEIKIQLNQKITTIQNLEEQFKRLKNQQRSNVESSTLVNVSSVNPKQQDHSICENKIQRLERQIQNLQLDNEKLRKKTQNNSVTTTFNFEIQSLKHEKQQARLQIQKLEKELAALKTSLANIEEEKYEANRQVNTLRAQISSIKISHEDSLFDKDRIIAQLRTKVEHNQVTTANYLQIQSQLQRTIEQKERELSTLRSRLNSAQSDIERMNDAINKYNKQINSLKMAHQSSHFAYSQQMEQLLEEKTRTLRKYEEEINSLRQEIQVRGQEITVKTESLTKVQKELNNSKEYFQEVERLKSILIEKQTVITNCKLQLNSYEQQNQRVKRQLTTFKEQIQRLRLETLQKDDEISAIRMEMSTLNSRLSNQIKSELMEQINEKDTQLSRLVFQIQSLQSNYNNIQEQLNEVEGRQRKAQQQLSYARGQLARSEEEMNQLNEKLYKKDAQISQVTSQMSGLKYLQEQVNEKNLAINKLRGELTSLRIQISHLNEQLEYKESTIIRQNGEIRSIRDQVMRLEQANDRIDSEKRNAHVESQRLKLLIQQNEMTLIQKDSIIAKLNADIAKLKKEQKDIEEEIEQREQEWSNIQYELNQAKTQINLISDQIQTKDMTIAKLVNETAFLKQEITRLNEELVQKNHEINRISQQVFVQKMEYTNRTSEEVQTLSSELFNVKRLLESTKHTVEDLEDQNRRLRLEVEVSRVRTNDPSLTVNSDEEANRLRLQASQLLEQNSQLRQENSRFRMQYSQLVAQYDHLKSDYDKLSQEGKSKQRYILQLELELNQRDSQIKMLAEKIKKLQQLLAQLEEENQNNNEYLQTQVEQLISTEKALRTEIHQLKSQSQEPPNITNEEKHQELKFGLKLYTQEADRLKKIIDQLTEEVTALKLKLTSYTNQENLYQQNLVTLVLTFAEVQALRQRMKDKEQQINEVRRSFIRAISNQDLNSNYRFKSQQGLNLQNDKFGEMKIFEELPQKEGHSLKACISERGEIKQQNSPQMDVYEVRSDKGVHEQQRFSTESNGPVLMSNQRSLNQQEQIRTQLQILRFVESNQSFDKQKGPEQIHIEVTQKDNSPQQQTETPKQLQPQPSSQQEIDELHQLKEENIQQIPSQQSQHVTFVENLTIEQNQHQQTFPQQVTSTNFISNQVTTTQQRGRTINIMYGSQIQTTVQRTEAQRVSQSLYQSPSGRTYVRITPQHQAIPSNSSPGVYVPRGMSIKPVRGTLQNSQIISMSQQFQSQEEYPTRGSFAPKRPNLRS